jgi:mono/diheme cytochrome c family protein
VKNALRYAAAAAALGAMVTGTLGCRGGTTKENPIVGIRNMYDQPKYNTQTESTYFEDHRTMRPPVENTVSRELELDPEIAKGRLPDDSGYVLTMPRSVVETAGGMENVLTRGQQRFGIYCSPCHDNTGSGRGMAVKRGMMAPPTFHQDRIRHMPDGQLFATISNGIRNMPAYGIQVPIADRWAIVAYVRALQLSQATVATSKESQL